jgi:hypothetical protein
MSDKDIGDLIKELRLLKLRELQVLADLEALVTHSTEGQVATIPVTTTTTSVVILNTIRRPLSCPVNRGDRTAIVTKMATSRVDLLTSNGTYTWRAPHNLRARLHDE